MSTVDAYLTELTSDQQAAFRQVREVVREVAPGAEEGTSYGMPSFTLAGRPLLGLKASARHLAIYPFSPAVVATVAEQLDGYDVSKGTIRFTPEQPLPAAVLREVVRLRSVEIQAA